MPPPKPTLHAALVADQVFQQRSGKWCIIGVFSQIYAFKFPAMHHSLGLFLRLGGALGKYKLTAEFRNLTKNKTLAIFPEIEFQAGDRLVPVELGIQTYRLPIPGADTYSICLSINDEYFQEIKIKAVLIERRA